MRKSAFYIDGGLVYIGYTNGDLWNGWATPYFTLEEAQRLQADWNRETEFPMLYDVSKDEFRVKYDGDDEPYIWKGEDVQTVDGKLHLYGIGAYSHIWDELGKDDRRYLAQEINGILYEYDPYEYNDQYDDEDEVIEEIISQLADIDTFAKAHAIVNDITITPEQTYRRLGKVIRI